MGWTSEITKISILRPGTPTKVKAFLEPAIEKFEAKYPNIKVKPMYMGWGEYTSKISSMLAANDQPNVMLWSDYMLSEGLIKDKLVPLSEYIKPEILKKNPFVDKVRMKGKIYLIPSSVGAFVFLWRKDVFSEAGLDPNKPPTTWKELTDYTRKIQQNTNVYPLGMDCKKFVTLQDNVSIIYFQGTGKTWLDENNNPIFNTPQAVKAIKFWKSLKKYAQPSAIEYARGDLRPLFRDKKVAMRYSDGPWIIPMLQQKFGKNLDQSPIGVGMPLAGPAGRYSEVGLDGWVIARKEHAKEAGLLISFLSSPEQQYRHDSIYGQAPIYMEEVKRPAFRYNFWKVFIQAAKVGIPRVGRYHPKPLALGDIFEEEWQKVWLNVVTPKEALKEAEKKIIKFNQELGINIK